jgi:hypothetical protein
MEPSFTEQVTTFHKKTKVAESVDITTKLLTATFMHNRINWVIEFLTHGWFSVGICKYEPGYKSHDLL